jgi:toxin ParE1/3/4
MAQVKWTEKALADLSAILDYLIESGPAVVESQLEIITRATSGLATFPAMGRPGRVPGTRELVVLGTPYIVAYIDESPYVTIAAIIHGARMWPQHF